LEVISAGIDAGQSTTKAVILDNGNIASHAVLAAGGESTAVVAERALRQAMEAAGMTANAIGELGPITATGSGRKSVPFAQNHKPEIACLAKAAHWLFPSARTVIDVGYEKCLALRVNQGRPFNFTLNDKCASGSGAFLETVSEMLELRLDDIGPLSLESREELEIKSTCVVFAESEIVSLVHAKKAREDILRGVFDGLALRVFALAAKIGLEQDVMMVGGVARNIGMVQALERHTGMKLLVPHTPQIAGALGAALLAQERGQGKA
jgi:predicted CoA-substrate-specific enzyme activase